MAEKRPPAMTILLDNETIIEMLSNEENGQLFRALLRFAKYGEITEFADKSLQMAFNVISNQIAQYGERYSEKCRINAENRRKSKNSQSKKTNVDDRQGTSTTVNDCERPSPIKTKQNETNINKTSKKEGEESIQPDGCSPPPSKPARKKYGEYKHVKLTDEQHSKLIGEFGEEKTAEYIRRVDEYCQQCGKRYSDYNLTIRNWLRKDDEKNGSSQGNNSSATANDSGRYSTVI